MSAEARFFSSVHTYTYCHYRLLIHTFNPGLQLLINLILRLKLHKMPCVKFLDSGILTVLKRRLLPNLSEANSIPQCCPKEDGGADYNMEIWMDYLVRRSQSQDKGSKYITFVCVF
jgi:hypothetical protein